MTNQAQEQNQIQTQVQPPAKTESRLMKFKGYLRSDEITQRFSDILGKREAQAYIMDVYLTVANSDKLQACTSQSITSAALRSAALHLSVDPATAHAYLIPYKEECAMQPGYKGYLFMALRTGKYRYINVGEVFEGESVEKDRFSGFVNVTGSKVSNKVIGYVGAFEMLSGYKHMVYWTMEQIYDHAKQYSQAYKNNKKDSPWFTAPESMQKKTVLRDLLIHWGYLDPHDLYIIKNDDEFANGHDLPDENHVTMKVEPVKSQEQIMIELGFSPDKPKAEDAKESATMPRETVDATTGEINPTPEAQPEQVPAEPVAPPAEDPQPFPVYVAPLCKIGKHQFPSAWGRPVMDALTKWGINQFEAGEIVYKARLPQGTDSSEVVEAVNVHLHDKKETEVARMNGQTEEG